MNAITLWRPWCWAILIGAKPVENRTWPPPSAAIGKRLALHSGRRFSNEDNELEELLATARSDLRVPTEREWPGGVVSGSVLLRGWISRRAFAGALTKTEVASLRRSPWFTGPFGWVVSEPLLYRLPVPCRGMPGLFLLPSTVASAALTLEQSMKANPS